MELLIFVGLVFLADLLALRFGQDSRGDLWREEERRRRLASIGDG